MPKVDDESVQKLERLLGHPLTTQEGCRLGFDQLSQSEMQEMRSLVPMDAVAYALFLVHGSSLRNAKTFVDNVIYRNMDLSEWLENYEHREGGK